MEGLGSGIVLDSGLRPNTAVSARAQPVAMHGVRRGGYPPAGRRRFADDPDAESLPRELVCISFSPRLSAPKGLPSGIHISLMFTVDSTVSSTPAVTTPVAGPGADSAGS